MSYALKPIGRVVAERVEAIDDFWGSTRSIVRLDEAYDVQALQGLDAFSHVEVLFIFDQVDPAGVVTSARHPRNNKTWPSVGIFAQRGKNRPNRIGSTVCRVVAVNGRELHVEELDAIDGTPVIDLKPVMAEFLPRGNIVQPKWSQELMRDYWKNNTE